VSGIFILDRITVQPGRLREYRELLEQRYLPGAVQRGMQLVGSWVSPPVELEGESSDLLLLWSLAGVEAFWAMRGQASADPTVGDWWKQSEHLLVSRERRLLAPADRA
jgi:hypothetical protein